MLSKQSGRDSNSELARESRASLEQTESGDTRTGPHTAWKELQLFQGTKEPEDDGDGIQ